MALHSSGNPGDRVHLPLAIDETNNSQPLGGILNLRDSGISVNQFNGLKPLESLGFASNTDLFNGMFRAAGDDAKRAVMSGDLLVMADMPTPTGAKDQPSKLQRLAANDPAGYVSEVHGLLDKTTLALTSDINKSNSAVQVPRAVAESFLRLCTAFQWDGTGISMHSKWQNDIPARRKVSTGLPCDDKGNINVEPKDWQACLEEVQNHRDQLNRKWGNCGEQAASMCAVIHEKIKNDPDYKGLEVRQAYSPKGHSWAEVKYADGSVRIYDPWGAQSGKREDLKSLREYYDDEKVCHSPWFGR